MFLSTRLLDYVSILMIACLLVFPASALALQPLTETEMSEITGVGFSSLVVEDNTAKMWLNIDVETNAYIETFKINYGLNPDGVSYGWDQDWSGVYLGEYNYKTPGPDNPLILKGFIFEVEFDDIDAVDKHLLSMKVGFENVNGEISADFKSFSGYAAHSEDPRTGFYREKAPAAGGVMGQGTFTFTDDYVHMIFDARGVDPGGIPDPNFPPGVYFDFGGAEFVRN